MFCFCWQVATKLVGVEALQSLLVAHKGTHCKHKCSKHPTRGAKWELILLRNKVRCQVNDVGDLQNLAPVVQNLRCNKGHCQRNWYRLFCKMPPRGAIFGGFVFVAQSWLFVANTRGKRFGSRWWGIVCTHGRFFLALVWKSGTPWCGFGVLVGKWSKLQSVCKQVAHGWGVLGNYNQKATPWWQKRTICFAVVGQSGGNGAIGCHCKNTHTGWAFSPFRT